MGKVSHNLCKDKNIDAARSRCPVLLGQFGLGILVAFVVVVCLSCTMEKTYSIEEQHDLWATRVIQMDNQLEFSFRFTPDQVPVEQDIFFVAVFTNTTDQPIVFREPKQDGVLEMFDIDTTLVFGVETLKTAIPFHYPLRGSVTRLVDRPVRRDEFVTLPAHGRREVRLKLPNLVVPKRADYLIFLPPGQYLVRMTYYSTDIGYAVGQYGEKYVDLGAWVGKIESKPALLTITP